MHFGVDNMLFMVYLMNHKHVLRLITMKEITRKDVEEITRIPARRIQFYTDNGLVTIDRETGKGRERRYSLRNVIELLIVAELAKHRIELNKIKQIMNDLREKEKDLGNLFDSNEQVLPERLINISDDGTIRATTSKVTVSSSSSVILNINKIKEKLPSEKITIISTSTTLEIVKNVMC